MGAYCAQAPVEDCDEAFDGGGGDGEGVFDGEEAATEG